MAMSPLSTFFPLLSLLQLLLQLDALWPVTRCRGPLRPLLFRTPAEPQRRGFLASRFGRLDVPTDPAAELRWRMWPRRPTVFHSASSRGCGSLASRMVPPRLASWLFPHGVALFPNGFNFFPWRTFPSRHAFLFGLVVSVVKTGGMDAFVQWRIEGKSMEEMDWPRVWTFALFGLFYLGGVQYFIYVPLYTRCWFPNAIRFTQLPLREKLYDRAGQLLVLKQVLFDQLVHCPFMYYPSFYILKECMNSRGQGPWVSAALSRYSDNFWVDMKALWSVWAPSFLINFTFCPAWMRIPFVALTNVLWTGILSFMRGAEGRDEVQRKVSQRSEGQREEMIVDY